MICWAALPAGRAAGNRQTPLERGLADGARLTVTGDGSSVTGQAGTHLLGRIGGQLDYATGVSAVVAG